MTDNRVHFKKQLDDSRSDLVDFFHWYIGDGSSVRIIALDPNQSARAAHFEGTADAAVDWAHARNLEGRNLYWVPNEIGVMYKPRSPKPTIGDMRAARFCWADADPDAAILAQHGYQAARDALLSANGYAAKAWRAGALVIDSGNGTQAFFKLAEPVSFHKRDARPHGAGWFEIETCVATIYGNDRSVAEASHIMRLPFAWNWPSPAKLAKGYPSEPSWARVIAHATKLFTLPELAELARESGIDPTHVIAKVADENIALLIRDFTPDQLAIANEMAARIGKWRDGPHKDRLEAQYLGSHRDRDDIDSSAEDFDYVMNIYKFLRSDVVEPERSALTFLIFVASPCTKRIFECGKKPNPQAYIRATVAAGINKRQQVSAELSASPFANVPMPPVGSLLNQHALLER